MLAGTRWPPRPDGASATALRDDAAGDDRVAITGRVRSGKLECELARVPAVVVIQESDPTSARLGHAGVTSRARSDPLLQRLHSQSSVLHPGERLPRDRIGTVDDHDHLDRPQLLRQGAARGLDRGVRSINRRDDYRYKRLDGRVLRLV